MSTINVSGAYVVAPGTELDFVNTNGFFVDQASGQGSPSIDNYGAIVVADDNGSSVSAVQNASYDGLYGGPLTNEVGARISVNATAGGNVYAFSSGSWSLNIFNKGVVDIRSNAGAAYGFNSWSPSFQVNNSGSLTVVSGGSDAYGAEIINGGSVTNTGTITVSALHDAYGVWIDRFEAGANNGRGSVVNSGTITASATGSSSPLSVGIQVTGLSVTYGGVANTITNTVTGTITAQIGISVGAPGYASFQEPNVAIVNAGVINGDIDTGDAVTTILNTGQVSGDIHIGSATTTIDLRGGVLTGVLYIDPSRSPSAINDIVYEQATGGVVAIGGGDAMAHVTVNGSSTGGVTTVMMPGSVANATLTANADGSFLVSTLVGGSATLLNVNEVKFSDGAFYTNVNSGVINAYQVGFGRSPTAAELTYWDAHVTAVSGLSAVTSAIVAEAAGGAYTSNQINTSYNQYFGRSATASEVAVWQHQLVGGADYTTLRAALLSAAEGKAHTTTAITSLYDVYMGRDPSSAELNVWSGLVAGGADFGTVRSVVIADTAGQSHLVQEVTSLYDTFFMRDPTAAELTVWKGLIAGGDDFHAVQAALVADPFGQATLSQTITVGYENFFGRAPTSAEISVWKGLFTGGEDIVAFRQTLLSDASGHSFTDPKIAADYQTYLGRAPSTSEISVWHGLFANGAGFDQLVDTLLKSNGGNLHFSLGLANNTVFYGNGSTSPYITVDHFDYNSSDYVDLSRTSYKGVNLLDAAHAHQITALDGSTDVLVNMDSTHAILFEHLTLGQLSSNSFYFG